MTVKRTCLIGGFIIVVSMLTNLSHNYDSHRHSIVCDYVCDTLSCVGVCLQVPSRLHTCVIWKCVYLTTMSTTTSGRGELCTSPQKFKSQ